MMNKSQTTRGRDAQLLGDDASLEAACEMSLPVNNGKWTVEEVEYMFKLTEAFQTGYLQDVKEGTTLRAFLAKMLSCKPKRISKRFEGIAIQERGYNGRQTYKKCAESQIDRQAASELFATLGEHELKYLKSEVRPAEPFSRCSAARKKLMGMNRGAGGFIDYEKMENKFIAIGIPSRSPGGSNHSSASDLSSSKRKASPEVHAADVMFQAGPGDPSSKKQRLSPRPDRASSNYETSEEKDQGRFREGQPNEERDSRGESFEAASSRRIQSPDDPEESAPSPARYDSEIKRYVL